MKRTLKLTRKRVYGALPDHTRWPNTLYQTWCFPMPSVYAYGNSNLFWADVGRIERLLRWAPPTTDKPVKFAAARSRQIANQERRLRSANQHRQFHFQLTLCPTRSRARSLLAPYGHDNFYWGLSSGRLKRRGPLCTDDLSLQAGEMQVRHCGVGDWQTAQEQRGLTRLRSMSQHSCAPLIR